MPSTDGVSATPRTAGQLGKIPAPIWAMGLTSLFMDTSSEAIHSLLPVFVVGVLGASPALIGAMEGLAEGLTAVTKLFSGVLSDRLKARKSLTLAGYALAAVSKPLFALAPTVGWVFLARSMDRFGKGIRGAPRDALVADLTPPELRGAAFGLRQALDTVGAIAGPLGAMALMLWLDLELRTVFWIAVIPAALAVLVLWVGVKEPPHHLDEYHKSTKTMPWRGGRALPAAFWGVAALGATLTMARFSEAFLILRGQEAGLSLAYAPLALVIMNVVYAAVAYPAGALADRMSPSNLLAAGCLALVGADLALAFGGSLAWTLAGIAFWGLHMGLTQGLLAALVAAAAPPALRATAFGVFNLLTGVMLVAASSLAGVLWQSFGSAATFAAGGAFAVITLLGTAILKPLLKIR